MKRRAVLVCAALVSPFVALQGQQPLAEFSYTSAAVTGDTVAVATRCHSHLLVTGFGGYEAGYRLEAHIGVTGDTLFAHIEQVRLAWTGLVGGPQQLPLARTTGQLLETIVQITYGILSLASIVTIVWHRPWSRVVRLAWAVSMMLVAGLASVVWGGTSLGIGLVSAGCTLLIALGVIWLLRVGIGGRPAA